MPNFIERRRRTWYAVLDVPADLRVRVGKRKMVKSLKTADRQVALTRAPALVGKWRAEFASLRGTASDPVGAEAKFLCSVYAEETAKGEDGHADVVRDQIEERAEALNRAGIDGGAFYRRATGQETATLDRLDAWLATLTTTDKTKDMQRTDVQRFAEQFPILDKVTRKGIREWADELVQKESLKPKTVRRILSAVRGYWRYLGDLEMVPLEPSPFDHLKLPVAGAKLQATGKREHFVPSEVVELVAAAEARGDRALADLIRLAMWTGCRIEELCSLTTAHVNENALRIENAKTAAGNREVPVHSSLRADLERLVRDSTDGYVLSGLTRNKYGNRADAIGKRFGRLKVALGHPETKVFHSIRKTVATVLEDRGALENVVADILGHEKPRITYGLYAGGTSLETKRKTLELLSYD